jgi:hypothetical protein
MLHWSRLGDMHFIVPENSDMDFWPQETKYKILDNGVYERGRPMKQDDFLQLARVLKVDEIVLPDVIMNRKETVKLTKEFLTTTNKEFQYAAVPQGKDPLEWIECYKDFASLPSIDVLCIPIWLQKRFGCRSAVFHKLLKDEVFSPRKEHHLIGLDGYGELLNYPYGLIRSVDTSLPFSRTAAGLDVTFEDSAVSRVSFSNPRIVFGSDSVDLLKKNINILLEAAHSYA